MKGSYSLILELPESAEVGSLGLLKFDKKYAVYNGSAFGSGGLKRVFRHFNFSNGCHWHIDYLLKYGYLKAALIYPEQDLECSLSSKIDSPYVKDFGCSDCHCDSHLFLFDSFRDALSVGAGKIKVLNKSRYNQYKCRESEKAIDDLIRELPDPDTYEKSCKVCE